MGREFELKYAADSQTLAALGKAYGPFREITMETAYYDTPNRDLNRLRWTLRRRLENGMAVCTVKTPAKDGGRGEWELPCDEIHTAVPALVALGAPEALLELTRDGVREVCAARFTRLAATLTLPQCCVELALDSGSLLGGGKALPFAEVEVELKSGSEEAVASFAGTLAQEYGLVPEPRSKVQRAMELAAK